VRFDCALLRLRGGAGVLDDLTRASGLLRNGITELSIEDTTAMAHIGWSGWTIDSDFVVGGIIFGVLAILYPAQLTQFYLRPTWSRHFCCPGGPELDRAARIWAKFGRIPSGKQPQWAPVEFLAAWRVRCWAMLRGSRRSGPWSQEPRVCSTRWGRWEAAALIVEPSRWFGSF